MNQTTYNLTRACTLSDLGLMKLEDALTWMDKEGAYYNASRPTLFHFPYNESCDEYRSTICIPAKSYAVSVVDRLVKDMMKNDGELYAIEFVTKSQHGEAHVAIRTNKGVFYCTPCPTNPFDGLVNEDGTHVTSATREEIEQWRREERG